MLANFVKSNHATSNFIEFQTDQLEEIKDIIEMKVSHRKNINRRRDRFGFESNSLLGLNMEAEANVMAPDADEENPFEM